MNIIKTNIADNEWNMDLFYDMFQSPDRESAKDHAGETYHCDKYCEYEEENGKGEIISLLTVQTTEGIVLTTTSPSFLRTFGCIAELAGKCNVEGYAFSIREEKSKNNREYITAVYEK